MQLGDADDIDDHELAEDEKAGNLATAVDVWLKAIRYTAALHATPSDQPAESDEEVRALSELLAFVRGEADAAAHLRATNATAVLTNYDYASRPRRELPRRAFVDGRSS